MSILTQQEIRERAYAFVKEWEHETREKAESQTFWNEFFQIFGINRRRVASFEKPVKKQNDENGSIDLFWKGILVVEHKSKGKSLEKAYRQALDYFPGITGNDLPQYVLVSDFSSFRLYDLDENHEHDFPLSELPQKIHLFSFISGYKKRIFQDEDPVNLKVAEKMGELHDLLLDSGYSGHDLEIFLVRLIYCLFADDTGIFNKDHFHYFLENRTNENGFDFGAILASIFQTLNTPYEKRQKNLDEDMQLFQYVNGGLFSENLPIPSFDRKMRESLLGCCSFDWGKVSPAIFGSMFQAVMDKTERRKLGAHYTSEKNILKVVKGLFLDEYNAEFEKNKHDPQKLEQLHEKISNLKFLDPACGCGNFLIITYRELRRLEIKILIALSQISKQSHLSGLDTKFISRLDVDHLFGIEIEEFPARIAEVAIWLTDHQMNKELSEEFGRSFTRLPLSKSANICNSNALRMDWSFVFTNQEEKNQNNLFILGNPPFIGKKARSESQNGDMEFVFANVKNYGVLDYVCSWYKKAADFIQGTKIQVAFVSTNSITQGEQVNPLWQILLPKDIKINFAHRTFRWTNEARGKAAVFCVIIGFSILDKQSKFIYDYQEPDGEPFEVRASKINPYLVDADVQLIPSRRKPICDVPEIQFGSMPNDDGELLFTEQEKLNFLEMEPNAVKFIRPLISAREYLHGEKRFCLWLVDAKPEEIRSMPEVKKRIEAVRAYRKESNREATKRLAEYPSLFGEISQPKNSYVLIPLHSSENRNYIPFAFFGKEVVANNSCATIQSATLYHFGILQSSMHMTWINQLCGRLEGRYRYSNEIVYNNYPWPISPTEKQKEAVEKVARQIIEC